MNTQKVHKKLCTRGFWLVTFL